MGYTLGANPARLKPTTGGPPVESARMMEVLMSRALLRTLLFGVLAVPVSADTPVPILPQQMAPRS